MSYTTGWHPYRENRYMFSEEDRAAYTAGSHGKETVLSSFFLYNKIYHLHSLITAQGHMVTDNTDGPSQQSFVKGSEPPVTQETLIELTDLNWEGAVEKSKKPVAVMFYSPACAFCHQMEPYFRSYARDYQDTIVFARLDINTSPWSAERYGVRSTPTFKFFCDGRPVQELVGAVYPALLKKMVDDVLIHGKECARNSTAIDYEITGYG